jgi:hypothetical protein
MTYDYWKSTNPADEELGSAMEDQSEANIKTQAEKIGELAVKLADAALIAHCRGDDVKSIFFAIKAVECLALAKSLGWGVSAPDPIERTASSH